MITREQMLSYLIKKQAAPLSEWDRNVLSALQRLVSSSPDGFPLPPPLFSGLSEDRTGFFAMVLAERSSQDAKWGFPQLNTYCEWGSYLAEESGEAVKELNDLSFGKGEKDKLVNELIQTAAMCLSIIEHMDVASGIRIVREGNAAITLFDPDNPY